MQAKQTTFKLKCLPKGTMVVAAVAESVLAAVGSAAEVDPGRAGLDTDGVVDILLCSSV